MPIWLRTRIRASISVQSTAAKARYLAAFTERGVRRTSSPTPRRLCDARREAGPELGRRAILCRLHAARHRLVEIGSAIRQRRRPQFLHRSLRTGPRRLRIAGARGPASSAEVGGPSAQPHRLAARFLAALGGVHERHDFERLFRRNRRDARMEEIHDLLQ